MQNKFVEQSAPGGGLHWTNIDSRTGAGYQIDKDEEVRLHFVGRGAKTSFALHF